MQTANVLSKKNDALLFLAGFNLILLNFLMVQHFVVALRQDEIAVILFSLSYFSGISLGFFFSDKLAAETVRVLFPVFLAFQMLLLVFGQFGVFILSEIFGSGIMYILVWLIVSVFSTSLYAVFLPAAVQSGDGAVSLRRLYSFEIMGSLAGLIAVPVLAGISHEFLLLAYFAAFLGIGRLIGLRKYLLISMGVIISLFLLQFSHWDKLYAGRFYRQWFPSKSVQKVAYTKYTPYHKIEILKLQNGNFTLLLNGKHQFSYGSFNYYSYFVAEYPARLLNSPRVCVLGCGSMSTVGRIGTHASKIQIVDLDEHVFKTSRRFFQPFNHLDELSNWTFTADDAKHYLANSRETFDLILHDIPPAHSRQTALTYTAEFFRLVKSRLTPSGIFSISSLTPFNAKSSYGKRIVATLANVFDKYFVLEYGSSVYFYGGTKDMENFSREQLEAAIHHPDKNEIRVMLQDEVKALVQGEKVITVNNVGDLIFA